MINKMLILPILALLTLHFINCAGRDSLKEINNNLKKDQKALQNDHEKPWEKIYFREINQRIDETEITTLRNIQLSNNSKEIRIWAGFDTSPLRGILLRQNNEGSTALFFPPLDSDNAINTFQNISPPRSGWANLWRRLDALGLTNLPDPMDIAHIDGGSVVVEIKSANGYRNYKYSSVSESKDKNYEKVREICDFLTNEFDVDLLKYYRR